MSRSNRKKRFRLLRLAAFAAAGVFGLLLVLWYLVTGYQPAGYQPRTLDKQRKEFAENYFGQKSQELYNNINIIEPFHIRFEEDALNDVLMLAQQEHILSKLTNGSADNFQNSQLHFSADRLDLMGRVTYKGLDSILTISFEPGVPQPGLLQIKLVSLRAGALTLPHSLIKNYLSQLLTTLTGALEKTQPSAGQVKMKKVDNDNNNPAETPFPPDFLPQLLAAADELLDHRRTTLDTTFRTEYQQVKLTGIKIGPGWIELALLPEPLDN